MSTVYVCVQAISPEGEREYLSVHENYTKAEIYLYSRYPYMRRNLKGLLVSDNSANPKYLFILEEKLD